METEKTPVTFDEIFGRVRATIAQIDTSTDKVMKIQKAVAEWEIRMPSKSPRQARQDEREEVFLQETLPNTETRLNTL